jgi:hypothetical protein
MYVRPPFLLDFLHVCEFIAMLSAIVKLKSLKNFYWKWFAFYLIYIFIFDTVSSAAKYNYNIYIGNYLSLIQIPLEFIFFYWLFAQKSLYNTKLFWSLSIIYLFTLVLEYNFTSLTNFSFKSLNNTIGTLLLLILVVLEFIKQIRSDTIINFKLDKMFYINIGVILFYIGNMPFFSWYFSILKYPEIWNSYYIYFMVSNCIMYLLFAASFIWGKPKS